jgi:hypothetical protein
MIGGRHPRYPWERATARKSAGAGPTGLLYGGPGGAAAEPGRLKAAAAGEAAGQANRP